MFHWKLRTNSSTLIPSGGIDSGVSSGPTSTDCIVRFVVGEDSVGRTTSVNDLEGGDRWNSNTVKMYIFRKLLKMSDHFNKTFGGKIFYIEGLPIKHRVLKLINTGLYIRRKILLSNLWTWSILSLLWKVHQKFGETSSEGIYDRTSVFKEEVHFLLGKQQSNKVLNKIVPF